MRLPQACMLPRCGGSLSSQSQTCAIGTTGDSALQEATVRVIDCLAGTVILAPDVVDNGNHGQSPGKFGVDEPWPLEPGHKPPK